MPGTVPPGKTGLGKWPVQVLEPGLGTLGQEIRVLSTGFIPNWITYNLYKPQSGHYKDSIKPPLLGCYEVRTLCNSKSSFKC